MRNEEQILKSKLSAALTDYTIGVKSYTLILQAVRKEQEELRAIKYKWRVGAIEQRVYQVYKAGTRYFRRDLDAALVAAKQDMFQAREKHYQLAKQYAALRKRLALEAEKLDVKKAEHLLADMSEQDIQLIRKYLEI